MSDILLVENSSFWAEKVGRVFEQSGCRVTLVVSVTGALQILRGLRYDAVVTELNLPEAGGMQLIKEIRRRDNVIPIVVVSDTESIDLAVKAMREGADDYVRKSIPEAVEVLLTVVKKSIERKKKAKRRFVSEGVLPICTYCKKVRHMRGTAYVWSSIEEYFEEKKAGINFSHGICTECLHKFKDNG